VSQCVELEKGGFGGGSLRAALELELVEKAREEMEQQILAGSIVQVEDGEQTRILLQGGPMSSGEPMLIWLTIDEDTAITWAESGEEATAADLAVDQAVEAELSGPVMESYPCQGVATKITITK
jgi:hypothetical protein